MSFSRAAMVVCLSLMGLFAASARANIVTNGGFETGDFSGWSTAAAPAGSDFSVFAQPHSGAFSVKFSADAGQHDTMLQVLPTTSGQQYTLEFWVLNYGVGDDSLQVLWEGGTALDLTPVSTPLESWEFISVPLAATANGSELRFRVFDTISTVLIDDVSVQPVPEPATVAMTIIGGLLCIRRRRQSTRR